MKDLIEESISILNNGGDIGGFGELLHEAWEAKRSLRAWGSNSFADDIYGAAIEARWAGN
jgi:D-glycero-alpha-D-manno-heptose-7-phosphate kinase